MTLTSRAPWVKKGVRMIVQLWSLPRNQSKWNLLIDTNSRHCPLTIRVIWLWHRWDNLRLHGTLGYESRMHFDHLDCRNGLLIMSTDVILLERQLDHFEWAFAEKTSDQRRRVVKSNRNNNTKISGHLIFFSKKCCHSINFNLIQSNTELITHFLKYSQN